MNCNEQKTTDFEQEAKSEAEFMEFIVICLGEGWSPTKCSEGCRVEPDGICPHEFKSAALEYGLI